MNIKIFFIFILILILSFSEYFLNFIDLNIPNGYKQILIFSYIIFNFKSFFLSFNSDKRFKYLFLLLILFSCINFFVENVSLINFLIGLIFTFLFHITFLTSLYIKSNPLAINKLLNSIIFIYIVAAIFSMSSFIGNFEYRSQITLFKELGAYGTAMNFGLIFSLTLRILKKNKLYTYIALLFTVAIFTTILKKSIFDCFFIWFIYFLINFRSKFKYIYLFFFFVLIYLMLIPFKKDLIDNIINQIEYIETTSTEGVRIIMYITAFNLSLTKFPFGSGLGTFGAPSSIFNDYSNTYYETGIYLIHELSPDLVMDGQPHTLFDTFWPHILGEFGFLGTFLFMILWFYPMVLLYRLVVQCIKLNLRYEFILFLNLSMFFVMTLDGITLFIPEIPLFLFLYNVISGLSLSFLNNLIKEKHEYSYS
jgi:hypothetical protein